MFLSSHLHKWVGDIWYVFRILNLIWFGFHIPQLIMLNTTSWNHKVATFGVFALEDLLFGSDSLISCFEKKKKKIPRKLHTTLAAAISYLGNSIAVRECSDY